VEVGDGQETLAFVVAVVAVLITLVPANAASAAPATLDSAGSAARTSGDLPDGCTRPGGCCEMPPEGARESLTDAVRTLRSDPQDGCDDPPPPSQPPRFTCTLDAKDPVGLLGAVVGTATFTCNHAADEIDMHIVMYRSVRGVYDDAVPAEGLVRDRADLTLVAAVNCEVGSAQYIVRAEAHIVVPSGYQDQGPRSYEDSSTEVTLC
jgi:hypothetical protein